MSTRSDNGDIALPEGWYARPPADELAIRQLGYGDLIPLPAAYLAFLRRSNGGEGQVNDRYVSLWSAEEIRQLNEAYLISRFLPGALAIGTDGGDVFYLLDGRHRSPDPPVLEADAGAFAGGFTETRPISSKFAEFMGALPIREE